MNKPINPATLGNIALEVQLAPAVAAKRCTWLVEFWRDTEDGLEHVIRNCGAPAIETYEGRGFQCEAGHEHIPIEIAFQPFGPEWQREQAEREGGSL
jgi:hypothetical protein